MVYYAKYTCIKNNSHAFIMQILYCARQNTIVCIVCKKNSFIYTSVMCDNRTLLCCKITY